jgi:tetratricopeptide (TPR) repeat protein
MREVASGDRRRPMENAINKRLKPTWLPRIMPVGGIIILLILLLPQLLHKAPDRSRLSRVEPPEPKVFATGYFRSDSLLNAGMDAFSRKDYEEASRLLSKVQFFWSVSIREKEVKSYPGDLLFYLGLSDFYRGHPELAVPLLAEEEKRNPEDERYPWYLAHVDIALGRYGDARTELERVVELGEGLAERARDKIKSLPKLPSSPTRS